MQKYTKCYLFVFSLIVAVAMIGCKDEDSPTTPAQKPTSPQISFSGPNTQSDNQYANQAKASAQSFNSQGELFKAFAQLPGTQNGNVWTYSFTANGLTETITSELLSNGSYRWKIVFDGLYEDDDTTITVQHWTAFEGTTTADGKTGSWVVYEYNSTVKQGELIWASDASGNETGTFITYTHGVAEKKLEVVNNVNGTGKLIYYQTGATGPMYKYLEISWLADGTGTYQIYKVDGSPDISGTF
ncbi:MAG: hypothetical protein WCX28_05745 [Bacteriovoracaceae bacterium]|nr:hypothetical protein [Bacteroidota bacterium]